MKYLFTIVIFTVTLTAQAQENGVLDSLKQTIDLRLDTISLPTSQLDSVLQSVQDQLNTLSSTDSLKTELQQQLDNLNKQQAANQKLDSLQHHYQQKADSLQALNLPHQRYLDKLDSLTQLPERKINEKIQQWQQQANEKLTNATNKLEQKLSNSTEKLNGGLTNKLTGDQALPELNDMDIPTEGLTDELGVDLDTKALDGSLNTSGLEDITSELDMDNPLDEELIKDNPLKELTEEADQLKGKATSEVDQLKEKANLEEVTGKVDEYGAQVGEVASEVSAVKNGDLSQAEERASNEIVKEFDELNALDENKALLEQSKAEHEEYVQLQKEYMEKVQQYSDPEFVKQRITEKSKYIANSKLQEYKSKIISAQEELAEVKLDTPRLALDIPNAEEWPLRDRLIAGANLEVFRADGTQLDVAPYLGLQLTKRLHLYTSYLYRIDFNSDKQQLNVDNVVYGPRLAATYRFFKGFYLRLSGDQLRTYVPDNAQVGSEQQREWVRSFYAGVGNRYNIGRHTKGTIQVMYNVNYNENTPFPNRYNIRMGFELDFRKRTTKKDVIEGLKKAQKKRRMLDSIKKKAGN